MPGTVKDPESEIFQRISSPGPQICVEWSKKMTRTDSDGDCRTIVPLDVEEGVRLPGDLGGLRHLLHRSGGQRPWAKAGRATLHQHDSPVTQGERNVGKSIRN